MECLQIHKRLSLVIVVWGWIVLCLGPRELKAGIFSHPMKDSLSLEENNDWDLSEKRLPILTGLSDSLLSEILTSVGALSDTVSAYQARLYVRGQYYVHRRNGMIRLVPSMFRFYSGVSDYLTESVGYLHYASPNIYTMKMRAYTGTFRRNQIGLYNTLNYLSINAYSPTLLPDKLLSPLDSKSRKYYDYSLDSLTGVADSVNHCLRVSPKNCATQLVDATVLVEDSAGAISTLSFKGRSELADFIVRIQMGEDGLERFLPKRYEVHLMFRFLWNKIEAAYTAEVTYDSIWGKRAEFVPQQDRKGYDMTDVYNLRCDDSALLTDTALIANARPFPLTEEQNRIYRDYYVRKKGLENVESPKYLRNQAFWGNIGDALVGSRSLNLEEWGHFHFSPLLDLGMIGYSHSSGFSYKQQFNYQRVFEKGCWLRLRPRLGYNFTHREFFWNADFDFFYSPKRLGAFTFKVGNGNRIYNSRVMEELRENKDSLIDFSKLNLDYFKDTYLQIGNRIELFNGLQIKTSLDMHWRKAIEPSYTVMQDEKSRIKDVVIQPSYVSFAPRVQLIWTPGQYYYMDDNRKIYLHSKYPTISFDYERGIKGVLGSNGSYERMEMDIQQHIPLPCLSSFYYRYGGGLFTEQKTVYFVDFSNFNRSYLPMGWSDDISGSFHLLDNDWYNSSRWYARAHFTYESPFIILPRLNRLLGIVHGECLYVSALATTHLHPYIELGYGIRTFLFNAGIFTSNVNGKFHEIGCKFTFELFRDR